MSATAEADTRSALPTIEALNARDRAGFERALGPLLERAPTLLERLSAERPFRSYAELLERAGAILRGMPEHEQVAVLDAHPRIGERGRLSALSRREQGADDEGAARDLDALNAEYERRFGFRFVVFVAGRPRVAIRDELRARLDRPRDDELRAGLSEYLAIAADRLRRLG